MTTTSLLAAEGFPIVMLKADMCRLLHIHENTLYARIKSGDVPAYKRVGRGPKARFEWFRPDVERWLEQRRSLRRAG